MLPTHLLTRWAALGLLGVLVASSPIGALEPVSLRPRWSAGEERRYTLRAEYQQVASDAQRAPDGRRVVQTATLRVGVEQVAEDGGATLLIGFESLRVELSGADAVGAEVFDSAANADAAAGAEPPPLASLCAALASSTLTVEVTPDGSVAGVTGLAPLAKALKESGGDSPALMGIGFFSPVTLRSNLAMLWQADPDAGSREAGASWQTSRDLTLGRGFGAVATTQWTLEGGQGVPVTMTGDITLTLPEAGPELDPAAPRLTILSQNGSVTADWNADRGLVLSRTEVRTATWRAEVDLGPGAAVPTVAAESSITSRIELRLVE